MAMFHSEGVYRIGSGVSTPRLLMTQPPEYTAGARAARIEGQVELTITVGEDGVPRDLRIEKPLEYGLEKKAIECVRKWRFSLD
jgi:TonB family protein